MSKSVVSKSSSILSVEEVVSIGYFGALTQLHMCNISGLTDEMLCALAPKLPILASAEIVFNDDVSHVGVNAFVRQANALTQLRVHGNELLHAEDVVAAVAANTTVCSRITDLSISPCLGVVAPDTLRALGMKCFQLGYFIIPAPPEPYADEIFAVSLESRSVPKSVVSKSDAVGRCGSLLFHCSNLSAGALSFARCSLTSAVYFASTFMQYCRTECEGLRRGNLLLLLCPSE